jgi:Na+-transporting NADH:ubiquinone oxidoreductase subunit NqrC
MPSRRTVLGLVASVVVAASGVALAKKQKKQKKHQNCARCSAIGSKTNGKHKLHTAGKIDVSVDVNNGKVVGLAAAHPGKGNLPVRKVKSR